MAAHATASSSLHLPATPGAGRDYRRCVHDGNDDPTAAKPADDEAVAAELERLLLERGPLSIEELSEAVAASAPQLVGAAAGEDVLARVTAVAQQSDAIWRLPDGRLAPVLHHLRRATFTHRLTESERERGAIDLTPDVVALALPRTVTLADGTALSTAGPEEDPRADEAGSLLGPDGWLDRFDAGTLLAIRYDGERVTIDALDTAPDGAATAAVVDALAEAFAALRAPRAPELHRLVVDAMGRHPACFATPVAPLSDLLGPAGLRRREVWVGVQGEAWQTPAEQARRRRLEEVLTGADACCQQAARRALDAWHSWLEAHEGGDDPTAALAGRALAEDVDHGGIAAVLADVATLGRPLVNVRRLGRWAAEVAAAAPSPAASLCYLQALGADADGEVLAAQRHLEAGLAVEADHPACLGMLAELAQDRGDAAGSLALLSRTGRPLSPEALRELEPFLGPRNVGRNEPCPCGSGRKFKACCARGPAPRPLATRARWLRTKAIRHAMRNDPMTVESLRQLFDVSNGGPDSLAMAVDMLLFPSRGVARYVDARGPLLPADELACARAWVTQPMRLLEVAAATDGSFDAVDVRTGEQLTIEEPVAAATVQPGEAVLARPLPVEDGWILSGTMIRVPPTGRDRTLAMLEEDVRPFHLLHLLVDFQVEALRP